MSLVLCLDMYGCPNRCKHCWIGHMPNKVISEKEADDILNQFKKYFDKVTFYSWLREPDYCDDYRRRWYKDCVFSTGPKPQRFELASFYRLVRDPEYVKFLKEVKTEKVQFTLFGLEETTDKYVGRKGAYQEILQATEILIENGIAPRWQGFINEENKEEIEKLLDVIDELKLKERCQDFSFFVHEGSCEGENSKLYDIRIRKESISERLKPYYRQYLYLASEKFLVEKMQYRTDEHFVPTNDGKDIIIYVSNDFNVYFNFTQMSRGWIIGNLKTDSMTEICRRIILEDIPALRLAREVTIAQLVEEYDDPQSEIVFSEDDYEMYLLNCYLHDEAYRKGEE